MGRSWERWRSDMEEKRVGTNGKEVVSLTTLTNTITSVASACGKAVPRFVRRLPMTDPDVAEAKGLEQLRRNLTCPVEKAKTTFKLNKAWRRVRRREHDA